MITILIVMFLLQAEVVGDSIGKGLIEAAGTVLLILAAIGGFLLFLWLVRRIDKKINK